MTRRSASHNRYQKQGKPAGSTRRSAASAKPKRAATVPAKSSSAKRDTVVFVPTPEYKKWRNIWATCLGIGAVLALIYAIPIVTPYLQELKRPSSFATWLPLIIAYAFIGVGSWIDFAKVRPLREAAVAASSGKAKPAKKEPAEKSDGGSDE